MTTKQLVFSTDTANPFAAAPPDAAATPNGPVELTGDQALAAWAYVVKLVAGGTTITAEMLNSIADKISSGVMMSARQLPAGQVDRRRAAAAAYFGINLPAA